MKLARRTSGAALVCCVGLAAATSVPSRTPSPSAGYSNNSSSNGTATTTTSPAAGPTAGPNSTALDALGTLFKEPGLGGAQQLPIFRGVLAAAGGCVDVAEFYGEFDARTRSLVVARGWACRFWTELCATVRAHNGSTVGAAALASLYVAGANGSDAVADTLPAPFDLAIRSLGCSAL